MPINATLGVLSMLVNSSYICKYRWQIPPDKRHRPTLVKLVTVADAG